MIDPGTSFAGVNRNTGTSSTRALSVMARHNASFIASAPPKSPSLAMMRARKIMTEARKIKAVQRPDNRSIPVHPRGRMTPTISISSSGESISSDVSSKYGRARKIMTDARRKIKATISKSSSGESISSDVSSDVFIETVARVGEYIDTLQGECADDTHIKSDDTPPLTMVPPVAIASQIPPPAENMTRYKSTLANARSAMASKSWGAKFESPSIGNLEGMEPSFSSVDDTSLILSIKSSNESEAQNTDRSYPTDESSGDRRTGDGARQIELGLIATSVIAMPAPLSVGDSSTKDIIALANAKPANTAVKKREPLHRENTESGMTTHNKSMNVTVSAKVSTNKEGRSRFESSFSLKKSETETTEVTESNVPFCEPNGDQRTGKGATQSRSGQTTPADIAQPENPAVAITGPPRGLGLNREYGSKMRHTPGHGQNKVASIKRGAPRRDDVEPSETSFDNHYDIDVPQSPNIASSTIFVSSAKAEVSGTNMACSARPEQPLSSQVGFATDAPHTATDSSQKSILVESRRVNSKLVNIPSPRNASLLKKGELHAKAASIKINVTRRINVEPPATKLIVETSFDIDSDIDVAQSHKSPPIPVSNSKAKVSEPNVACARPEQPLSCQESIAAHVSHTATDSYQTSILGESRRISNVPSPRNASLLKKGELAFRKKRDEGPAGRIIQPKVSTVTTEQYPSHTAVSPKVEKTATSNAAHRKPNDGSGGSAGGTISPKVSAIKKAQNPTKYSPVLVSPKTEKKSTLNVAHREPNEGTELTIGPLSIKKDVDYYAVLSQIQKSVRLDNVSVSLGKILADSARRGMSLDAVTEIYKLEMLKARDHAKSSIKSKSSVRDDIRKKQSNIVSEEMTQQVRSYSARTSQSTGGGHDCPSAPTSRRRQVSKKSNLNKVAADMQALLNLCDEVKALFSTSITQRKNTGAPAKVGSDHSVTGKVQENSLAKDGSDHSVTDGVQENAPPRDGSDHYVTGGDQENSSHDEDDESELGIPGLTDAQLHQLTQLVNRAEGLKDADLPPQVWDDDDVKQSLGTPRSTTQDFEEIDAFFSRFSIQDYGEQERKDCKENNQNNDEGKEPVDNESSEISVNDEHAYLDKNVQNNLAGSGLGPKRNPLAKLSVTKKESEKKVDTSICLPNHLGLWKSPWQSNGVTAPESNYIHGTRRQCFLPREKRVAGHSGYLNIDFYSLYETAAVNAEDEDIDRAPWELRDVGQRFLHEKSLESRNWFGKSILCSRVFS
jgi:hypothetical protein